MRLLDLSRNLPWIKTLSTLEDIIKIEKKGDLVGSGCGRASKGHQNLMAGLESPY